MFFPSSTRSFLRSIIAVSIILFCFCSCKSVRQIPPSGLDDTAIEQNIQRIQNGLLPRVLIEGEPIQKTKLEDRMAELRVPGVSIAVIHNGKIEWARGFGVMEKGGPSVTPDTLFQAGSISKPVASMAALRLVESGKIDLDTDINQYLKSWQVPSNTFTQQADVTIRRLLSHTAGMTVNGFSGYPTDALIPSLVQILNGEKPANSLPIVVDTVPGKIWRYSGGGYEVMQLSLQDITGKTFPELMKEMVLDPVGMTQSTFEQPLPSDRLEEAVTPYLQNGQPVRGGAHVFPEMAANGLWTTPLDLAKFAINIQEALSGKTEKVLSQEMAGMMTTSVLNNYGLGLMIGGSKSNPYFSHGGGNVGFWSNLIVYNNGDGAVIMTNSDTGGLLLEEILRAIAYEYNWPDFQPVVHREIPVAPGILEQYVGTYQLDWEIQIKVILENGKLITEATAQGQFPIFAETETNFFLKVVDATIEFIKDYKGEVTHLVLSKNGEERKAPRISKTVDDHKEIAVSPSILSQYKGTYNFMPEVDLIVTVEDFQLFAQPVGQAKLPLIAETETKFFIKVLDATIEFFKDDNGAVTHLIFKNGSNNIKASRK